MEFKIYYIIKLWTLCSTFFIKYQHFINQGSLCSVQYNQIYKAKLKKNSSASLQYAFGDGVVNTIL